MVELPLYEELVWYDGPLIFITRDLDSNSLYYCHWHNIENCRFLYFVFPITETQLSDLKSGNIALLDLFMLHSSVRIEDDSGVFVREVQTKDILDQLPEKGVTLYAIR